MKLMRVLTALLISGYIVISASAAAPKKPKLIIAIVVDQFRYDYLLRFKDDYTSGFKMLLDRGAVFDDAHHVHFPTVTAVGHSTFLSGAVPSISGIVGNQWYDREMKKVVTSVSDPETKLVGGIPGAEGSSPRRMLVSTVGDEIKMQGQQIKVIGISIKDRGAILPSGHMADAAYWFDADSNRWTTSSYYMGELPRWVSDYNGTHPHSRAIGAEWKALDAKPGDKPLCTMVAGVAGVRYCESIEASPWGNELIEEFAEKALANEKLGTHPGTDVLTVSFSSNDYVGHAMGPDAPEIRDISRRTDLLLGKLLTAIDKQVGLDNVTLVLTADHGVSPVPEVNNARKMPGGRLADKDIYNAIQKALETKYGEGKWVLTGSSATMPYLDTTLTTKYKASEADVEATAAEAVRALPHIFRVYTAADLLAGRVSDDIVSKAISYGFYPQRAGNLFVIQEPYYLFDAAGTSHGTPFDYDSHVPVIFMGAGIKPGHYFEKIAVNDIAPTLAAIAGVETPSGSVGRVLQEIWQ
jgi:predicted AlkP superfamily pyrophosphatase or phosphodiesterase